MGRRAKPPGCKTISGEDATKERYGEISAGRDGHVALLEIDRPPHNHVTVDLMTNLADALNDVDADRELRASVLMTAGKSFCAGADFAARDSVGSGGTDSLYAQAVRLF